MVKADFNGEYEFGIACNRRVAETIVRGLIANGINVEFVTNRAIDTEFSYRIVSKKKPTVTQLAYASAYIDGVNYANRSWT